MIREMSSFILLRKPFHAEGWTYPWVKALLSEIRQREGALSKEVLEAIGLEMLRQDSTIREEVGGRKLRKLIEALGQEADSVREKAKEAALDLLRREDLID